MASTDKKHSNTRAMEKLGDKIEHIAKPIAKTIDKVLPTDIEHCESCERIRKLLNDKEYVKAFKERFGLK